MKAMVLAPENRYAAANKAAHSTAVDNFVLRTFRGFDPKAPLHSFTIVGNCMDPVIPAGTQAWINPTAPFYEGDLVGVRVPESIPGSSTGFYFTLKQYKKLRDPRNGQMIDALLCLKQPAGVMLPGCQVIGPLVAFLRMPPAFHDPCTAESDERRETATPGIVEQLRKSGVPLIYADLNRYQ